MDHKEVARLSSIGLSETTTKDPDDADCRWNKKKLNICDTGAEKHVRRIGSPEVFPSIAIWSGSLGCRID